MLAAIFGMCYKIGRGLTDDRRLGANRRGGKSELHRTTLGVTPLRRKVRNSGTERMSGALSLKSGTGDFKGAAGVKTAKLSVKQDQIGKREISKEILKSGPLTAFGSGRLSV